jgi:hypothetical protein
MICSTSSTTIEHTKFPRSKINFRGLIYKKEQGQKIPKDIRDTLGPKQKKFTNSFPVDF